MTVAYAWAPITKSEKQDDGTLIVYGPAASSALDRDEQRLDEAWLDEAMPQWMAEGGNVREQHDARRAVGVGVGLSKGDDGAHFLAAHIVDPVAVKKVETGVLKGFSVGIKAPKIQLGKADAPKGLVTGGSIVEVSVVDRPANPGCLFTLAKADGAGDLSLVNDAEVVEKSDTDTFGLPGELYDRLPSVVKDALSELAANGATVTAETAETGKTDAAETSPVVVNVSVQAPEAAKADLSAAGRRKAAASGAAMPDGCLSAETLVATRSGPRRIDTLVGACEVLTDAGWADAEVQSFGVKPLLALTLNDGVHDETVYVTAGHRWLLSDGTWKLTRALSAGDRIPHVEVLSESVKADGLDSTQRRIAGGAEKSANSAGRVVMVDMERRPTTTRARVGALQFRDPSADCTEAALLGEHGVEVSLCDAVLAPQDAVSSRHPALVGNFDALGTPAGALAHAEAAVSSAPLLAGVEVGVGSFGLAGATRDRALVVDGHADSGLPGVVGSELSKSVLPIMPRTEPLGIVGLSTIGYDAKSHTSNLTRSQTWRVVKLEETQRVEEVFCAVVPDLHRFVLANGVLTGNSYPIQTKSDLRKAIKAVGRGNADHSAIRKHIIKRAKALGLEAMVPENWQADGSLKDANKADGETIAKAEQVLRDVRALAPALAKTDDGDGSDGSSDDESEDITGAEQAIAVIAKLIIAEAESLAMGNLNEACDIDLLLSAVRSLTWFKQREESEQQGDGADMSLADEPDAEKAAAKNGGKPAPPFGKKKTSGANDAGEDEDDDEDDEDGKKPAASKTDVPTLTKADVTELVKAAVAEANSASEERNKALEAELAKAQAAIDELKALPQPGGPVLTRTNTQEDAARKHDAAVLRVQANEYLAKADACSDRYLADGYREKAADLMAKADA